MDHVVVDGARLEARWWRAPQAGGRPIVLLHEGLGSVSAWRDFPARLAARTSRDVFAYSRRGYGQSAPRGAALAPSFMHVEADAHLPRVLDAAGIPRAVLFGHSDGGSIALLAAAAHPERVEALVLEAPHVFVEDLTLRSIAAIRAGYADGALRQRLQRHHAHVDDAFIGWADVWLDQDFSTWDIRPTLAAIQCAVLLIQGGADEYGTLAQLDAIERGIPRSAERLVIQNCGHSPHRDDPHRVLEAATRFLARLR